MNKFKNNKGVTMVALVITIIIMIILLSVINYGSKTGIEMKNLNNMYADILILEDKIALYYLNNGELPILKKSNLSTVNANILENNPNNNDKFYVIDISLLENITLNNMKDPRNTSDRYIINEKSHTVYYQKGITIEGKTYYTIPEDYQEVNLNLYQ